MDGILDSHSHIALAIACLFATSYLWYYVHGLFLVCRPIDVYMY
jgi:hypothetical protein